MSEPEITIRKIGYYQPTAIVGTDDDLFATCSACGWGED